MTLAHSQTRTHRRRAPGRLRRTRGPGRGEERTKKVLLYVILAAFAHVAAFPFYWMVVASTRTSATILNVPPPVLPGDSLIDNYRVLMMALPFWRSAVNSLVVATISTLLVLFFCSLGGYAFAKFSFPWREHLFRFMLLTMMVPSVLGIIPLYILMREIGWLNTYLPLIVPGAANAFGIFWMRQYITGAMPNDLLESARLDGCHEFRIYWSIVLPIIRPGLGALAILTFMGKWNEFFWPLLILKDENRFTLPVALQALQGLHDQNPGVQLLGSTLTVIPIIVVFLFSSRQFMSGLTAGAFKG